MTSTAASAPAALPAWNLVEIPPVGAHRSTVFWLHGLGADGQDFVPVLPALRLPAALGVRFVFPEAPVRPVTLNGGMWMRAWYDIESIADSRRLNREHLEAVVSGVRALLAAEAERGIPPERVALVGFSQGGAVALAAAAARGPDAASPPAIAGLAALSSYLPFPEEAAPAGPVAAPVFLAHGLHDEIVPFAGGTTTRDALRANGWNVDFRSYAMGHEVCEEEIRALGAFLRRTLEAGRPGSEESGA